MCVENGNTLCNVVKRDDARTAITADEIFGGSVLQRPRVRRLMCRTCG